MVLKFKKIKEKAVLPNYQTEHSAGMDVMACIDEDIVLKPFQRQIVPTGLAAEISPGHELQVRARSGLAAKHGVSLVNGIGTIDADYRGEIGIILINLGQDDFLIKNGDRIAQLVLCRYEKAIISEEKALSQTNRGQGGFGSTGQ